MATANIQPTLKQLEALVWTARLGSFRAAADRLNTTQSGISKRVFELEGAFGVQLFDRRGRQSKLTGEGSRMLAHADQVLQATQDLIGAMDPRSGFRGVFRLGVTEMVALTWLPRLIQKMRAMHPRVTVAADVDVGTRQLSKLGNGLLDAVIVPGPAWGKQFASKPLKSVEICWMASPSLGLPNRPLTAAEMSALPIIEHSPEAVMSQLSVPWLKRHGFQLQSSFMANSLTVIAQLAIMGLGVGRLPEEYFRSAVRQGKLRKVRTEPALPPNEYFVVHRNEGHDALLKEIVRVADATCDFRHPNHH